MVALSAAASRVAARIRRSLFTKAVALVVVAICVYGAAARIVLSGGVSETAAGELVLSAAVARTLAATFVALLVAFLAFIWTISRRTARMVAFAEALAEGDLAVQLEGSEPDELGRLAAALARLRGELDGVVRQLRDGSGALHVASDEVLRSAENQVALASVQSSSVEQAGDVVGRLRDAFRDSGEQAEGVLARARESEQSSREGAAAVGEADVAARALRDQADAMAGTVKALVDRTAQIASILDAMHDFAEQSHVLSVNASIEAARAGEAGRGFAIVATEVRRLAERSRGATTQVKSIVQDVQRAARASLAVVEESRLRAQESARLAGTSGDTIRRLAEAIGASSAAADRIARTTAGQGDEVAKIWNAVQAAFHASREVAAGVTQLREASRSIAGRADHLRGLVEIYRLPEDR
jgi:methyl-accepting chemotaxis protein